ncbi:hypothetical protein GCM10010441_58760 [Kitasatospora paracochleata]|uniref:Low molecular weight protein antigen 6 PH domain-containing protein n=1 Tax=Kitasatospora paracochleata TaxID=58354 RepID=A0ABT1J548_9ACTN|nr:PH domain-containing protein [Kitasatospora paracochleata]MCP2312254.1 hypothetical protein [Kitasatospora paracochleata]
MTELTFRARDIRLRRRSLVTPGGMAILQAAVLAHRQGGVTLFLGLCGGVFGLLALGGLVRRRSWTTVGTDGITTCGGLRRRSYPWQDIRWIDVRETRSRDDVSRTARITLASGRRRSLPGLVAGTSYTGPDFDAGFQQLIDRWELSTDPADRVRPAERRRLRRWPAAIAVVSTVVAGAVAVALW